MKTELKIGFIIDPAPLDFFKIRVMAVLASNFYYSNIELERDMDSMLNEKILTINFAQNWEFARLMHLLTTKKFVMQGK